MEQNSTPANVIYLIEVGEDFLFRKWKKMATAV